MDALAAARVELGASGASGRYIKHGNRAESGLVRANRARLMNSARNRLGLKVEGGSDRRVPPGSDAGTQARPVIRCCEGRGGARRWFSSWAARRAELALRRSKDEKGGRGKQTAGEKKNGPSPIQGEGEEILFHFLKSVSLFLLKQNTFQNKI